MNISDVVLKLVGPIEPIGETNVDDKRLENLETLFVVTEDLVNKIKILVEEYENYPEYSMKRVALTSAEFLSRLRV